MKQEDCVPKGTTMTALTTNTTMIDMVLFATIELLAGVWAAFVLFGWAFSELRHKVRMARLNNTWR